MCERCEGNGKIENPELTEAIQALERRCRLREDCTGASVAAYEAILDHFVGRETVPCPECTIRRHHDATAGQAEARESGPQATDHRHC